MQPKYLKISVVMVLMVMLFLSSTAATQASLTAQSTPATVMASAMPSAPQPWPMRALIRLARKLSQHRQWQRRQPRP